MADEAFEPANQDERLEAVVRPGERAAHHGPETEADVTDALADPARLRRELASRDASRATAGGQQGGQHAQRRRLARTIGAEEPEDLASPHVQVDAGHRLDLSPARLEDATQSARLDYSFRGGPAHRRKFCLMRQLHRG